MKTCRYYLTPLEQIALTFFVLSTREGNIAPETALCQECFQDTKNRLYARDQGDQSGDVDTEEEFQEVPDNGRLLCCNYEL